ncbi:MAG: hypothetical protein MR630_02535 [Selenomonas sp.]|uniref:hypothetical protein n=1 Tax=Selenomonas sp. TaxID=2053611 RepID=UPI0025E86E22|nr:hypothetical protein [Selenomonas sp.]MCI6099947.1 hypothetical protein [Selenomonas sp.]MCI6231488.1 hypothetical protein [Selenomonas sp.]
MHQETIEKVEASLEGWQLLESLPPEIAGFHFSLLRAPHEDMYDIFSYENPALHRRVTAYFHEETQEYKLRVRIGFIEFCRIEFITASLGAFSQALEEHLAALIDGMVTFHPESLSSLVLKKGIREWPYGKQLPETLEGHELFIRPQQPVKITNGSYIIIDYVDFEQESDVTIYYNMYRDEFWGEVRAHSIPDVSYVFDCHELDELQKKLEEHLVPRLHEARNLAVTLEKKNAEIKAESDAIVTAIAEREQQAAEASEASKGGSTAP